MSEPTPIRDGVTPEFDGEREMIDYCALQVRRFADDTKMPPTRVAIVLQAYGQDGKIEVRTNSWASDNCSRVENCSIAAAVLTKRATE